MADLDTIRRIAEYAPHMLTPEDRRLLRLHDPVNVKRASRWPYLVAIACAVGLAVLPAWAEPVSIEGNLSTYEVTPSDKPGAVAEVHFHNELEYMSNGRPSIAVAIDGIEIQIDFAMMGATIPDRMTVVVPEGYIAVPGFVDVNEGETGTVTIYTMDGVGM